MDSLLQPPLKSTRCGLTKPLVFGKAAFPWKHDQCGKNTSNGKREEPSGEEGLWSGVLLCIVCVLSCVGTCCV